MSVLNHLNGVPPGTEFDPSLYPRTYSVAGKHQFYWIAIGFATAVGYPWIIWRSHGMHPAVKALVAALPVLVGGYFILEAFKLKLVLEPDAITLQHSFSRRRMLRCEIAGRRTQAGRGGTTWQMMIPREEGKKALGFPEILRTDPAFAAWFADIPRLEGR